MNKIPINQDGSLPLFIRPEYLQGYEDGYNDAKKYIEIVLKRHEKELKDK